MNELLIEIQKAAEMIATPNRADRIEAIASIVAVVVSVIAFILAYKAADGQKTISKQQNKISLFNLRYDMYSHIFSCYTYACRVIDSAKEDNDLLRLFPEKNIDFIGSMENSRVLIASQMVDFLSNLYKAKFLFPYNIGNFVDKLANELISMTEECVLLKEDSLEKYKTSLQFLIKEYESKNISGQIAKELYIGNN